MKVKNPMIQQLQIIQQKAIKNLDVQTEIINRKLIKERSTKQKLQKL